MVLFHEMGQASSATPAQQSCVPVEFKKTNYNMNITWLRCSAYILYIHVHMGHTWMLPRVTHSLGLKMNFEKIKLLNHTLAVCCHLFLVSGWFWSHSKGFSISFLLPLLKRGKVGQSPHTYDSTRSLLPLENRKALKFCFGRTKLECYMYFIILSQLKWNRSFSHGAWARKTSTFRHFECVPPSTVTPFSQ